MKKIYLFTNFYPYSKNSENFLDSELEVVNQEVLAEVYIIPLHKEQFCRILPEHIKLCDELAETTRLRKIVVGLKMLYSKWFWKLSTICTIYPYLSRHRKSLPWLILIIIKPTYKILNEIIKA